MAMEEFIKDKRSKNAFQGEIARAQLFLNRPPSFKQDVEKRAKDHGVGVIQAAMEMADEAYEALSADSSQDQIAEVMADRHSLTNIHLEEQVQALTKAKRTVKNNSIFEGKYQPANVHERINSLLDERRRLALEADEKVVVIRIIIKKIPHDIEQNQFIFMGALHGE